MQQAIDYKQSVVSMSHQIVAMGQQLNSIQLLMTASIGMKRDHMAALELLNGLFTFPDVILLAHETK